MDIFNWFGAPRDAPVQHRLTYLSFQQSRLQPHAHTRAALDLHIFPIKARSFLVEWTRYFDTDVPGFPDSPAQTHWLDRLYKHLDTCSDKE